MTTDAATQYHRTWIGYLQPDGLVVSPAALVDSQAIIDQNLIEVQQRFLEYVSELELGDGELSCLKDAREFIRGFLEWPDDLVAGKGYPEPIPPSLTAPLPEFSEILEPTFAVKDPRPKDPSHPWFLLVQVLENGADLDAAFTRTESGWSASPGRRFERLLRGTKVPIGVLINGTSIRLMYAPHGENAGNVTFPIDAMTEVAGRPILGALKMLLHKHTLFSAPSEARLPALLEKSRAYQSTVSEELAKQVLDSLYELVRGIQAADEKSKGELLKEILQKDPDEIYRGLLTVLLRLVFLLYAEDRGLISGSKLYVNNYSVHGLFERLRADDEKYPDTMDQRYGAWSQLLALFRAVYDGSRHPQMLLPARKGFLFDPDRYSFLEGRTTKDERIPLVSDGVIYRVLRNLLILGGERLSYRTLDVEQIGSVYETMVGFKLEVAQGHTIALKPSKSKGAPVALNLDDLLSASGENRLKLIRERSDNKLTGEVAEAVKTADTLDSLLAALERRIARNASPGPLPPGSLVLQPTDERRRTGSHYTPRSLTEPIVHKTLEPILKRLGDNPAPQQILDLKIADIAEGSGAFLVETSRQLGEVLVKAWHTHKQLPVIPPDEDEVLHARRLVAQRCLYGVDRNPMAVDLAKLSLWLATLAKDHPFTFLDHSIRCGDSLVGLTRKQLADFHWRSEQKRVIGQNEIEERIKRAADFRKEILEADEFVSPDLKRQKLELADESLNFVRQAGDCVIAAFFSEDKDRKREAKRDEYLTQFQEFYRTFKPELTPSRILAQLRGGEFPITPFHWEIEFPEVFDRENQGFDAIVGNPPFAGKNTLINGNRPGYLDWLKLIHEQSHGNSDLVAHFYRRAFDLLRTDGSFGLIATNTISQGDTRNTGLRWIRRHDGTIYAARKRFKWPGQAAVIVSIVWASKGESLPPFLLDSREVNQITSYLFHAGTDDNPAVLNANEGRSFQGSILLGMGFTFDDNDSTGKASSLADMDGLLHKDPRNSQLIFPYIGGEEVNNEPDLSHHRFAIDFFDRSIEEAAKWPDLLDIVRRKVKPDRDHQNRKANRERWWQYAEKRPGLHRAVDGLPRVLVTNCGATPHMSFAFLDSRMVFANTLVVIATQSKPMFCILQSRIHEVWARFMGSSMKDDLRYTPHRLL